MRLARDYRLPLICFLLCTSDTRASSSPPKRDKNAQPSLASSSQTPQRSLTQKFKQLLLSTAANMIYAYNPYDGGVNTAYAADSISAQQRPPGTSKAPKSIMMTTFASVGSSL